MEDLQKLSRNISLQILNLLLLIANLRTFDHIYFLISKIDYTEY